MKKHVLTALFAVILAASASAAAGGGPSLPPDVMRRIDTADGRLILSHLANDYFKGRDTPSEGLDSAARFIVEELKSAGLQPVNGSYYHNYVLERVVLETPSVLRNGKVGAMEYFSVKT